MKRAILIVGIMLAGFSATAAPPADEVVITIGATAVLSGTNARIGKEQLQGLQLWVEETNARGGLLGRKLRLLQYDDEASAEAGARLYEKLITQDKVDMLIGPYGTEVTLAAAGVADHNGFPMIVPGAATTEVWERGYKNLFGLYTPANNYLRHALEFAKRKGLRRIALVYQDTPFARGVAEGIKSKVQTLGMWIVFEQAYDKDATDFAQIMNKLKPKGPDVIVAGSYLPDALAFMRQAKDSKLSAKVMVFATGSALPEFGDNLGADAEGVMGVTQWEPTLKLPGAAEFARRYKTRFGAEAGYLAAGGFAAGQVLEGAVRRTGSVEREALRKALTELDTPTIFGRYKVDASGRQVGKSAYVIQWINGERVPVLPEEVAVGKVAYPFKSWSTR